MWVYQVLRKVLRRQRDQWKRRQTERLLHSLPFETQKDIGWPAFARSRFDCLDQAAGDEEKKTIEASAMTGFAMPFHLQGNHRARSPAL